MSADLLKAVEQWIQFDPNPTSKAEVEALYNNKDFTALDTFFTPRIAFGTAGLRSKMAPGYKNMNELVILQTSQGLCAALLDEFQNGEAQKRGVVIGYDGRHNSKTFAEVAANVFLSKGIKVYLFPDVVPTPFVPWGMTLQNAVAGIMVTASHNPKQDNGYKLYRNGLQITPPYDAHIAESILNNLIPWSLPIQTTLDTTKSELLASTDEMKAIIDAYFVSIKEQCCFNATENSQATVKATYTAMHGVGAKYTARALETFGLPPYIPTIAQVDPDPEFPTVAFPNPEEGRGALALAMEAAEAAGSTLILANDPDADRLAVAVKNTTTNEWVILTGNEIATLFADYNYHQWCLRNAHLSPEELKSAKSKLLMVASTVSSKQLKSMADVEGLQFRDTLTGFKWIGTEAKKAVETEGCTILVAYEVEIGFIVGHTSYDKDGVRCAAQMYELANYWASQHNQTLFDRLEQFAQKYGYFKMTNSYFFAIPAQVNEIAAKLRDYKGTGTYPTSCGPYAITSTRDVTLGKDNKFPDGLSILPIQNDAQMLTFSFENGAVCTLRNSGTEPKLKYYVEVVDYKSKAAAEQLLIDMTKTIIAEFIQPELYSLVAKKE